MVTEAHPSRCPSKWTRLLLFAGWTPFVLASTLDCSRSPASMAAHFNDLAANDESQPERVLQSLRISPGDRVADLGAGGGFFTLKLSRAVGPTGRVHAVDIEQAYLDLIELELGRQGIDNVELVLGTAERSNLPAGSVDLVFVRNTFHDITNQADYFASLREVLAEGGRVAIIDYEPDGLLSALHGHAIAAADIERIMIQAGYERIESHAFLTEQSFQIFRAVSEPE